MLKAEVAGIGFPEKGTPQGGIISPLLSNIVLNELDWWIASQWEEMPTDHEYKCNIHDNGSPNKNPIYLALRKTALKECYIVRYADDFKIFCRKRSDAVKLFEATKQWLKARLGLDISPEKSRIVKQLVIKGQRRNHILRRCLFSFCCERVKSNYCLPLVLFF